MNIFGNFNIFFIKKKVFVTHIYCICFISLNIYYNVFNNSIYIKIYIFYIFILYIKICCITLTIIIYIIYIL